MNIVHVPGKNKGKVMLYALSTCGWCKKTRALLEELGVEYDYCYVDLEQGEEQDKVMEAMGKHNPNGNFPTIVINSNKAIIGFMEDDIKQALK
jgi:glutaredoxin-like protein NrdH